MKLPSKKLERTLISSGYNYIVGIDEVGVGCIAGPVTACAVAIHRDFYKKTNRQLRRLRDSKQLLPHQREKYCAELINNHNLKYALYSSRVSTIDKLGISEAIHQAMFKALHNLNVNRRSIILIDGKKRIEKIRLPQKGIVKGDEKIFAIACASIIAKVHRDKLMSQYDKKFLGYGFGQHKGYPTKLHKQKIRDIGPCVLHRKSFRLHSLSFSVRMVNY